MKPLPKSYTFFGVQKGPVTSTMKFDQKRWIVVSPSPHVKNMRNLPQIGVNIKKIFETNHLD